MMPTLPISIRREWGEVAIYLLKRPPGHASAHTARRVWVKIPNRPVSALDCSKASGQIYAFIKGREPKALTPQQRAICQEIMRNAVTAALLDKD